jgi:pimeloyl-ACP methyl ester carboxylesterase
VSGGRTDHELPAPGKFADVNSRRIHYVAQPGEGIPVLLLHGMPGTHLDFERVLPLLAGRPAIAIDRPGYGWCRREHTGGDRRRCPLLMPLWCPRSLITRRRSRTLPKIA